MTDGPIPALPPAGGRLLRFLPVAIVLLVLVPVFLIGLQRDPRILPSALIGKQLPPLTLSALEAGDPPLTLAGPGPAVRLVNVWASWCAPCRIEHPTLIQLEAAGVPIDGVLYKDSPGNGRVWLTRDGDPYRAVGLDPDGRAGVELGVYGVPETFVVAADGTVLHRVPGPLTPEVLARDLAPHLPRAQLAPVLAATLAGAPDALRDAFLRTLPRDLAAAVTASLDAAAADTGAPSAPGGTN